MSWGSEGKPRADDPTGASYLVRAFLSLAAGLGALVNGGFPSPVSRGVESAFACPWLTTVSRGAANRSLTPASQGSAAYSAQCYLAGPLI